MAILADNELQNLGSRLVTPFDSNMVQPASIDVHIDRYFYEAQSPWGPAWADPAKPSEDIFGEQVEVPEGEQYVMNPGAFVLASTFEKVTIPSYLVARFEGKSSLGRLGLLTHITAGFIDPGFEGHITLELKNVLPVQMLITPGMKIGQLCFERLSQQVSYPYGSSHYGSHYQGQRGPTLSRSHQNFSKINVY